MKRILLPERPDWQEDARAAGFIFHTFSGAPYWQDAAAYAFGLRQIEDGLETPAERLHAMCLEVVDHACADHTVLRRLAIPERYHDWITDSWRSREPALYGRFDFAFDGNGPAKLYEYNADTPTSIFEAAAFQWRWLEARLARGDLPANTDQWTSLHEALIERFRSICDPEKVLHFSCVDDGFEDRATTLYLEDCARQSGLETRFVEIADIGVDAIGRYADDQSDVIEQCFKLYPWEFMQREPFGKYLVNADVGWIEPPWKSILSNKGLLPLLWEGWPGHENLLPTYFGDGHADLAEPFVTKPLFSREGANISVFGAPADPSPDHGYGDEGRVCQAYHPLPDFEGHRPVLGVWMIGDEARGLGIREQKSSITDNDAMFVPHIIDAS